MSSNRGGWSDSFLTADGFCNYSASGWRKLIITNNTDNSLQTFLFLLNTSSLHSQSQPHHQSFSFPLRHTFTDLTERPMVKGADCEPLTRGSNSFCLDESCFHFCLHMAAEIRASPRFFHMYKVSCWSETLSCSGFTSLLLKWTDPSLPPTETCSVYYRTMHWTRIRTRVVIGRAEIIRKTGFLF